MCHISDLREHLEVQYIFIGDEFKKNKKEMETGFVLKSAKCGDGRKTEKKKVFFSVYVKN